MGRARRMLRRNPFTLEGPSWENSQGAVERLEDLMRRYTQRRDARNGQRHTLAEDIRMAALEALLPEELERTVSTPKGMVGQVSNAERRSRSLCRSKGLRCTQGGPSCKVSEKTKDDPMDVGGFGANRRAKGKGQELHWQRKGDRKRWCEIIRTKRKRRKFKVNAGIDARVKVINQRIAGQSHSNTRVRDSQNLLERAMIRKASRATVQASRANPKMPEQLSGLPAQSQVQSRVR